MTISMNNSSIQIALYGVAHGHISHYVEEFSKLATAQIIGVFDADSERALSFCNRHKLRKFDNPEDLLSQQIDVVIIGCETAYHLEAVSLACRYVENIALQKPLATTIIDGRKILREIQQSDARLFMLWQMRVDPANQFIKQIIDEKRLGQLLHFRRRHCLSTHRWPDFQKSWHVNRQLNLGMWADDAAHPIDLMQWLFGSPKTVYADIDTLVNPEVPDDNGIAIFRYDSGLFAEIQCSFTSDFGETTTELVGTDGMLIQYYGDAPSCNHAEKSNCGLKWKMFGDGQWRHAEVDSPENHSFRIKALAPKIIEFAQGLYDPPPSDEYLDSLTLTLLCYESSSQKKQILLGDYAN